MVQIPGTQLTAVKINFGLFWSNNKDSPYRKILLAMD